MGGAENGRPEIGRPEKDRPNGTKNGRDEIGRPENGRPNVKTNLRHEIGRTENDRRTDQIFTVCTCKQRPIHRPKKKSNLLNEARIKACINKFNSGVYDRLQFLKTVSHSLGAHIPSLHDSSSTADSDDDDDNVPQPPSPTDAAATPATAASTSLSPEVADCCEVCLLVL